MSEKHDWYTVDDCLYCAHCDAEMRGFVDLDLHLVTCEKRPRPEPYEEFDPIEDF